MSKLNKEEKRKLKEILEYITIYAIDSKEEREHIESKINEFQKL